MTWIVCQRSNKVFGCPAAPIATASCLVGTEVNLGAGPGFTLWLLLVGLRQTPHPHGLRIETRVRPVATFTKE